jgi:hypothetical protein
MAFLGSILQKISGGHAPEPPPRMSHAFGARSHDHSHDAGFATGTGLMFSGRGGGGGGGGLWGGGGGGGGGAVESLPNFTENCNDIT